MIGRLSAICITSFKLSMSMSTKVYRTPALIQVSDALGLYQAKSAKFLDGSWHLNKQRKASEEFIAQRIPGAQHFDIDEVSDKSNPLPHMLPSEEIFADKVSSLGISSSDHVIVYSHADSFSAPRVWWMFHVFGHENVSVLNGGIQAWIKAGGEIQGGEVQGTSSRGNFVAKLNPSLVVDWSEVLRIVNDGSAQIADARSLARFLGQAPEPRVGLAGGHIPGSLSMPFTTLTVKDDVTTLKPLEEINEEFERAGVVLGGRTVASCGSGVTAAVLALGHYLVRGDLRGMPIYDGSWSEWGARKDLPVINPAAETATAAGAQKEL